MLNRVGYPNRDMVYFFSIGKGFNGLNLPFSINSTIDNVYPRNSSYVRPVRTI